MDGIKKYLNDKKTNELIAEIKSRMNAKEPLVFKGTSDEWDALDDEQKEMYTTRYFNNDYTEVIYTGAVTNAVEEGNVNAVSSNAVYLYLKKRKDHPDDLEYKENDPDYDPPDDAQADESFDTFTETWADGSRDIFGVGVLGRGGDDERITRIIYPDGSEMSLTGI